MAVGAGTRVQFDRNEGVLHMVRKTHPEPGDPAAGNGILSRRIFLEGALVVGATGAGLSRGSAEPLTVQPWMKVPGPGFAGYGQPSPFESKVIKVFPPPPNPAGVGASRTPLHLLEGMITPSGLHFERSHSGHPRNRSRSTPAGDPWTCEASACIYGRSAVALSDAIAHRLHRVRRQQPGAQRASGPAAQCDGHSRPAGLLGMDRRAALHVARRSRHRT